MRGSLGVTETNCLWPLPLDFLRDSDERVRVTRLCIQVFCQVLFVTRPALRAPTHVPQVLRFGVPHDARLQEGAGGTAPRPLQCHEVSSPGLVRSFL